MNWRDLADVDFATLRHWKIHVHLHGHAHVHVHIHTYICMYIYIYVTYNICKYVYIHSKNLLKSHWADSQKRKTLRVVTRRVLGSDMSAADNTNRQLEHFHVTTIWKRWRVDRC